MSKWTFFEKHKEDIQDCSNCSYGAGEDYYSLYYLEIKYKEVKDYKFNFHTLYDLGKSIFAKKDELPQVEHGGNEDGIFKFGRSLFEDEKVIYREKDVTKKFLETIEKYKMYYEFQYVNLNLKMYKCIKDLLRYVFNTFIF